MLHPYHTSYNGKETHRRRERQLLPGAGKDLCLGWDTSPQFQGLLIEHILECEQKCSCEDTLSDLGSNACFR